MEASELEALKDKQMEVKYLKMYIDRIYIDLYRSKLSHRLTSGEGRVEGVERAATRDEERVERVEHAAGEDDRHTQ